VKAPPQTSTRESASVPRQVPLRLRSRATRASRSPGDYASAPAVCGLLRVRDPGTIDNPSYAAASTSRMRAGSMRIPGPIVVEIVTLRTYRPFAEAGLARRISSTTAR